MPWRVSGVMSERLRFVERLKAGESMSELCREFGISRKSGYKFVERFERWGEAGLLDSSRRPRRIATRTPEAVVDQIVALRAKHPTWGPRKLRQVLVQAAPDVRWPCRSTFAAILQRKQLSRPPRRRRTIRPYGKVLARVQASNEVWCIDYKGQFKLRNGRYCYPLTVTDEYSRYVLVCEGFESISGEDVAKTKLTLSPSSAKFLRTKTDNLAEPFMEYPPSSLQSPGLKREASPDPRACKVSRTSKPYGRWRSNCRSYM